MDTDDLLQRFTEAYNALSDQQRAELDQSAHEHLPSPEQLRAEWAAFKTISPSAPNSCHPEWGLEHGSGKLL